MAVVNDNVLIINTIGRALNGDGYEVFVKNSSPVQFG